MSIIASGIFTSATEPSFGEYLAAIIYLGFPIIGVGLMLFSRWYRSRRTTTVRRVVRRVRRHSAEQPQPRLRQPEARPALVAQVSTMRQEKPVRVVETPQTRTLAAFHQLVQEFHRVPLPRVREDAIPILAVDNDRPHWICLSLLEGKHSGIFGASQNGKGMLAQFASLCALTLGPERVEVVIIDMKRGVDYAAYAPYLEHCKLFAEHPRADGAVAQGFAYLLTKMNERYDLLDTVYPPARNMREYNQHLDVPPMLPMMVIVDEASALRGKQVNELADLTERAAAAGITLFVVTTNPDSDSLSSRTIFNLKNRVVFGINAGRFTNMVMGVSAGDELLYNPFYIPIPGIALLRREGGQAIMGRTMPLTDEIRQPLIERLIERFPRKPIVQPAANPEAEVEVSTVSEQIDLNHPSLQAFLADLLDGETLEKETATMEKGEISFPASERHFTDFNITLAVVTVAEIVAKTRAGERPTDVVKSIPGYSWRRHANFVGVYEIVYNELCASGEQEKIDAAREARRREKKAKSTMPAPGAVVKKAT